MFTCVDSYNSESVSTSVDSYNSESVSTCVDSYNSESVSTSVDSYNSDSLCLDQSTVTTLTFTTVTDSLYVCQVTVITVT